MGISNIWRRLLAILPHLGLSLALLSALAAMISGLGSRWGWWDFRAGFAILPLGALGGLAAMIISLIAAIVARGEKGAGLPLAVAGVLIGLVVFGIPVRWVRMARSLPMIHDITTDTENPPTFIALLPRRADAPNPAKYGGPEIADQQREAYPEILPLRLNLPPDQAYNRALAAAHAMGWEIVEADSAAGRIEATDTTFWFGFKDDVVVRVTSEGGESRIDVRSLSRVGKSDVGTNARRISGYFRRLQAIS